MNTWIYFNEKSRKWEVKMLDGNRVIVLDEFNNRGDAYRLSAWGIR
jgi:hypothetical protein